jgi:hypothetical protein
MFDAPETTKQSIKELAEGIVLTENAIEKMEQEAAEKREVLISLMQQTGQTSVTLDSGLAPKLETKHRIGKKGDVENQTLFGWLKENGLADIIQPTVHPGTLQSSLEAYIAQGGQLPETLFSQFDQPSIRMNGRSRFLAKNAKD